MTVKTKQHNNCGFHFLHSLTIQVKYVHIAIASGDVQNIKNISVNTGSVMTIENKTSFQRLKDGNFAMIYLGGFANRHQIEFLRKVISDNPNVGYYHFGDIDVGGFLIHKHLYRETAKSLNYIAWEYNNYVIYGLVIV